MMNPTANIESATATNAGFKQTEVGWIPVDWEVGQLFECCSKITDGTHDTPKPISHGTPFLTALHIKDNYVNYADCYFLPKEVHEIIYNRCNPERNDVLFVNIGAGIATSALIKVDYEFSLKNVALLKPSKSIIDGAFLNYALTFLKNRIVAVALSGGAQPFLSLAQIGKIKIPLPPTLAEQTAIAAALSDMDALIQVQEELLAKKRALKQGAMQELLRPKEGWVVKSMSEIGKPYGGLSGKAKKDFEGGNSLYIPFLNVFTNPVIDTTYFDSVRIRQGEHQNKAQKGDLFFNGSSETPEEVGMCSVLLDDIPNLYLNSFCFGFCFHRDVRDDGLFLSYYFRSDYGREKMYLLAQGATRFNLSKTNFLRLELELPDPDDQIRIANILSDMDTEIKQLEAQLAKYQQLKVGMMQELLTGKKRLI